MKNPLNHFVPYNEQEKSDLEIMKKGYALEAMYRNYPNYHFTTSAWIVNQNHTKVLMAMHKIYQSYAWLGGHNDGEIDFTKVLLKEIEEESGLTHVKVCSDIPFSIEILAVQGHFKHGSYVSSHLHYNITYLVEASETDALHIKPDENTALKWIPIEDIQSEVKEVWMWEHVYKKLCDKLKGGKMDV